MATVLETTALDPKVAEVREFRTLYFVSIRSTPIQRWAARLGQEEYYTLTTSMWLKGTGAKRSLPDKGKVLAGTGRTIYFDTPEDAEEAAHHFLARVRDLRGVKW